MGTQHSETLQIMLDFFEANRFTLFESLGSNLSTLEKGMKARINTVVAILKDIEKTQTKPTHEMIQLLFTEKPSRKEILVEKKPPLLERNSKPENSLIKRTDANDDKPFKSLSKCISPSLHKSFPRNLPMA